MIILVEGLYKDIIEKFVFKLSRAFNLEFVNCETWSTFEDCVNGIREHPNSILYNTWVNRTDITQDEKFVLNNMIRLYGGFGYYITCKDSNKLLQDFDADSLKNIDYNMIMLKMNIPIIAKDINEMNIEP